MTTTILEKLSVIEKEHDIKLLYACESGSRGWEFPSPDSDYDVRFIYTRQLKDYLSIDEKKDHLAFPITDELDIYGWDLRKILKLIRKSNTTPFEWLQSPIVYLEEPGFRKSLWDLCAPYFDAKGNTYHYLGIAKGALGSMDEQGSVSIKKLFYILRPLLAALWCTERKTIAPMSIIPLLALLSEELQKEIKSLIAFKLNKNEGYKVIPSQGLNTWINETFNYCSSQDKDKTFHGTDYKILNDFFIKELYHDNTRT